MASAEGVQDMSDQITVVGTVATDPERRQTSTGLPVINFRLATNVRRRDEATGAWVDGQTNWYAVSAYRGLAEHALESIRKGHRVIVSGTFKLREWEANGRQGVAAEIDAIALGHDLLWGTTVYRRAAPPHQDGAATTEGVRASPDVGSDAHAGAEDDEGDGGGQRDSWAPAPGSDVTPF